ncbi:MAG: ribose-5-phosphate isomerase RpiA [Candidatus Wallbacteria bacterium]|nr:ribose-5-phosphate isomerase RpiA [Candidatus Wallbacteria bacterium]
MSEAALERVPAGATIGLGSGRAAMAFVKALGERVRAGLAVRGVPTSRATQEAALLEGIPLATPDEAGELAVTFDGADEVDPNLDMIKGWGAALVREKIVAAMSRELVILVGAEKLVTTLGERGKLPIEVVPFGLTLVARRLDAMGIQGVVRTDGEAFLVTDNGNHILDCAVPLLQQPAELERRLLDIPGVVGTGLFLGLAHTVFIQRDGEVEVRSRQAKTPGGR